MAGDDIVVREAKLFEAAFYPERGIEFTASDLDAIVEGFKVESAAGLVVPMKVQHVRSPWEGKFGKVVEVWRVGLDLMGRIAWPRSVWQFLDAMGTKSLSVGFDMLQRRLREVSVVDKPRVLSARAFDDSEVESPGLLVFSSDVPTDRGDGVKPMSEEYSAEVRAALAAAEDRGRTKGAADERVKVEAQYAPVVAESAVLRRKLATDSANVKLSTWTAEGKLPPACCKYAEAILVDGASEVTFSDGGHMSVADALVQFMTHLPAVVDVAGTRVTKATGATEFEKRVYAALGITEAEAAAADDGGVIRIEEKGGGEDA